MMKNNIISVNDFQTLIGKTAIGRKKCLEVEDLRRKKKSLALQFKSHLQVFRPCHLGALSFCIYKRNLICPEDIW